MPRGTGRCAPSAIATAVFREKPPQYTYVSSYTARVGATVRSIALEESVVPLTAQVSFAWKHEHPEQVSAI